MDFIRHYSGFGQFITMEQKSPYIGHCLLHAGSGPGVYTQDYMLQAAQLFQYEKNETSCRPREISILGCRS